MACTAGDERMNPIIAASIMCADPLHLGDELRKLQDAGVDLLHCDVMDGRFVPNLAMGPYVLAAVKEATDLPLDIHLAAEHPSQFVPLFAPLHPEYISFHVEAAENPERVMDQIRRAGIKPAIAVSPPTDVASVYPYLDSAAMVLMMTVYPGFAGQPFQEPVIDKIARLSERMSQTGCEPLIEVDGNIYEETARKTREAGADVFVVGTAALFNRNPLPYPEKIARIREAAGG